MQEINLTPEIDMSHSAVPKVRLYSKNHASCVGVGEVQDDEIAATALQRWRPHSRKPPARVVVTLSDALVPAAFIPHKNAPFLSGVDRRVTMKDILNERDGDKLVLWDIAHVRLLEHWTAPPATTSSAANESASAAYDGDEAFFSVQQPCRVVLSPGKVVPPCTNCVVTNVFKIVEYHGC